jgi:hypothetical protein
MDKFPPEMTMIAMNRKPLPAHPAAAGVSASLVPSELGYASGLALLSRFSELMAKDGIRVDTRRMQIDAVYAYDLLTRAHTSACAALRECAMQVFALFQE